MKLESLVTRAFFRSQGELGTWNFNFNFNLQGLPRTLPGAGNPLATGHFHRLGSSSNRPTLIPRGPSRGVFTCLPAEICRSPVDFTGFEAGSGPARCLRHRPSLHFYRLGPEPLPVRGKHLEVGVRPALGSGSQTTTCCLPRGRPVHQARASFRLQPCNLTVVQMFSLVANRPPGRPIWISRPATGCPDRSRVDYITGW
jgi:hypothetical protein